MGERAAFVGADTRIGELGFPGWTDVSQRISIADLFFKKQQKHKDERIPFRDSPGRLVA